MSKEKKCFEFLWKIEKFSKFIKKKGECISSPTFVIDFLGRSEWKLSLYSNEENGTEFIGFYLKRDSSVGAAKITIDCQLMFLSSNGSPLRCLNVNNHFFASKHSQGSHHFIKRNEVITKSSRFLLKDTLTACCRIWKNNLLVTTDEQLCSARTIIGVEKRKFRWKIDKPNSSVANETNCVTVDFSSQPRLSLKMGFCLEGNYLKVSINQAKTTKTNIVTFKILSLNSYRFEEEYQHCFNVREVEELWHLPLKIELAPSEQSFNPIILYCECSISTGVLFNLIEDTYDPVILKTISDSVEGKTSEVKVVSISESGSRLINLYHQVHRTVSFNPVNTLQKDIQLLFRDGILSDFSLISNNKIFRVHKTVLGARSPFFRAMLSSAVGVAFCSSFHVEDMSCENIQCMLKFLYTDTLDDLKWVRASEVYSASVKYGILPLQRRCANILKDAVCILNACEILCFSDLKKDDGLKTHVQTFILQHGTEIFTSNAWKNIEQQNIQLAVETMRNYFFHKAKGKSLMVEEQQSTDLFRSLEEDVVDLYNDNVLCDFKLKTKGETFSVHKAVLGVRSPIFRAMFESSMKETNSDTVFIEDLSAETVRRMLDFMYTGKVKLSEWDNASKLYFASDKYDMLPLKDECRRYFINNLSVSNVCKILVLADMHQDGKLKTTVIDYVFKHDAEIIPSEYWKEFISNNYQLACETMREIYLMKLAI